MIASNTSRHQSRLFRRLRFWNVDAERVIGEPADVQPEREQRDVKERCGGRLVVDAGLREMQAAHAIPHDGRTWFDRGRLIPLGVEIRQFTVKRAHQILVAEQQVVPHVGHRILEIEHHAGRSGVEHLDDQLGIVCRPGHLIALIGAPFRQCNAPIRGSRFRCASVRRERAVMRAFEYFVTMFRQARADAA